MDRASVFQRFGSLTEIFLLISVAWIMLLIVIPENTGGTNHEGTTSGDEQWITLLNPHRITNDFTIRAGDTVVADPGVIILFGGSGSGKSIIVNGNFYVNGTKTTPITISVHSPKTI